MNILCNAWVRWLGLTGVLIGAVGLPIYFGWKFIATSGLSISNALMIFDTQAPFFIDIGNGDEIGIIPFCLLLIVIGANIGGALGVILGLIISKYRTSMRTRKFSV